MASRSEDEENIEQDTGRRTRSGRKPIIQQTPSKTRKTTKKLLERELKTHEVEESDTIDKTIPDKSEVIKNLLLETADELLLPLTIDNKDNNCAIDLQERIEIVTFQNSSDMKNLENNIETENSIQHPDEEKSSSFPFGNVPNENSDGKTDENVISNISDCVDSSLLASLAGDNANSLPSVDTHDETQSPPAIAEDLRNGDNESERTTDDIDAEMVSEDEISNTIKSKLADAEEVSDDDLPATKRAELPADTEVVSEDELPSNSRKEINKRKASEGYDPSSPTGENTDIPEKRLKNEIEEQTKDKKKEKKKTLPELEKYWKVVKTDPTDFTGWTYLLQYVDQENDIEAAREAYDSFLARYPYCYGYWRKYADYEKRKGNKIKCEEVFERGLKAIPLSVDLWIHYLTYVKVTNANNEDFIRAEFYRGLDACGLEFRSDKLWEAFIKWELEGKRYEEVLKIYDRLLTTPTQGYNNHFDSFQDLINNHPVTTTVGIEEFKRLRTEVRDNEKNKDKNDSEELENEADDHVKTDEELSAIKEKIIAARRKVHKITVAAVTARWAFEEGIKRPYFHVKPLERCQLKNWKDYLDFEIERGDRNRILILFERCLIACALYDEFWLKLIRYLESQNDPELLPKIKNTFERACLIHHPDKPSLHLMWSAFEECQNNFNKAAEILLKLEKICPNILQVAYRRINLERRRGDYQKCQELYEQYIATAKNKNIAGTLAIKYARFCHKIMGKLDTGYNILKSSLEKDPSNTRIALQMIDMALQRDCVDEEEIVQIMEKFMSRDSMEPEQKVLFAQRKVEFLEDFGSTAQGLQDAQRALQLALTKVNEAKKKSETSPSKKPSKEAPITQVTVPTTTVAYNNSNYGYGTNTSNAGYYGSNQNYQQYDGYSYNHWQQYGTNYSGGYAQWGGGYGNYY